MAKEVNSRFNGVSMRIGYLRRRNDVWRIIEEEFMDEIGCESQRHKFVRDLCV